MTTKKSKAYKADAAATKTRTAKKPKAPRRGTAGKREPKSVASHKRTKTNATLRDNTKLATVTAMLRSKEGATIEQLVKATGWQAHSVRGAMSGALKKKLGMTISSTKTDGVRTYRIAA